METPRKVFYINDGEEWWISAHNPFGALTHLAIDHAGYNNVEKFIDDHDINLREIKELEDDDILEIVDPESKVKEKKTAKEWASEIYGVVGSTLY